jgi:hypothetical protein
MQTLSLSFMTQTLAVRLCSLERPPQNQTAEIPVRISILPTRGARAPQNYQTTVCVRANCSRRSIWHLPHVLLTQGDHDTCSACAKTRSVVRGEPASSSRDKLIEARALTAARWIVEKQPPRLHLLVIGSTLADDRA